MKKTINLKTKFKRNPKIIFREVEGLCYILESEKGQLRSLNDTASFIWKACQKPIRGEKIVEKLCDNFDVTVKTAEKDVKAFINKYFTRKFIIKID